MYCCGGREVSWVGEQKTRIFLMKMSDFCVPNHPPPPLPTFSSAEVVLFKNQKRVEAFIFGIVLSRSLKS